MAQSISQQQQQQLMRENWLAANASSPQMLNTPSPHMLNTPSPQMLNTSNPVNLEAFTNEKRGKETIHSGHFMVSHFEAEAQDDEDTEIEMPDPDESAIIELNQCIEVQLMNSSNPTTSTAIVPVNSKVNSSAVIDISLAKLFKCMNLAYRLVNYILPLFILFTYMFCPLYF